MHVLLVKRCAFLFVPMSMSCVWLVVALGCATCHSKQAYRESCIFGVFLRVLGILEDVSVMSLLLALRIR